MWGHHQRRALIGLGLACIGVGYRYQDFKYVDADKIQFVQFRHMDTALVVGFIVLIVSLLIGLGIAFVGLAYHHHRRGLELTRLHGTATTPPATGTGERIRCDAIRIIRARRDREGAIEPRLHPYGRGSLAGLAAVTILDDSVTTGPPSLSAGLIAMGAPSAYIGAPLAGS